MGECGFTQSEHDECIFFKGSIIYLLYTGNSILARPDEAMGFEFPESLAGRIAVLVDLFSGFPDTEIHIAIVLAVIDVFQDDIEGPGIRAEIIPGISPEKEARQLNMFLGFCFSVQM